MSVWQDMAHDAGYRGEEAAQLARMLEESEHDRWARQQQDLEHERWAAAEQARLEAEAAPDITALPPDSARP